MEVVTQPSDFTPLLKGSGLFAEVVTVSEMGLVIAHTAQDHLGESGAEHSIDKARDVQVAVLLESLDRVDDPGAVLQTVYRCLGDGGLIFVTALVSSGFDVSVLGLRNLYIYPPDRTNCFSLRGLELLVRRAGFSLLEVSTPGVLDVEIVRAHIGYDPSIPLSVFERQLVEADNQSRAAFQEFLQQRRLSSFARVVARKQ
jgi:hypothetical protein